MLFGSGVDPMLTNLNDEADLGGAACAAKNRGFLEDTHMSSGDRKAFFGRFAAWFTCDIE